MAVNSKHKASLVLGSGAARGLAHIDVIKCLEEHDYDVRSVAGSSMGALIGGIYAAGELDLYTDWVTTLKTRDIVKLLDLSFSKDSFFKGERIIEVLKDMVGDRNIEELPIGYTAVATDLNEQKEIWFTQGSLFDAIRASIAIPMIFSPVKISNRLLVDGGIINPIPIAPTLHDNTELTIAVALDGQPEIYEQYTKSNSNSETNESKSTYRQKIDMYIDNLLSKNSYTSNREQLGAFNLITQSMETMQTSIARYKIAAYRPDIVIEIPRNICLWYEFDRAQELISIGYNRAQKALANYYRLLQNRV